jgi:hypothetical protein
MRKSPRQSGRLAIFALLLATPLGFSTARPVAAGVITFNFEGLPNDNATNTQVKTYMQGVLDDFSSVLGLQITTLTKAKGERDYDGDGHVVGPRYVKDSQGNYTIVDNSLPSAPPVNLGYVPRALTLGSSDGGQMHDPDEHNDKFIVNNGGDRITMVFDFLIYAVSFDYEIFPNGSDPNGTAAVHPDFTFKAGNSAPGQNPAVFPTVVSFQPTTVLGEYSELLPYSPFSAGATENSTKKDKLELAPQYLGESGLWLFPEGVNTLEFWDWPEKIGVDNLQIYTSPVPEPGSLAIWCGTIAVGTVLCRRKRRKRAAGAALSAAA